jgi:Ca2+/Na+ antiporter
MLFMLLGFILGILILLAINFLISVFILKENRLRFSIKASILSVLATIFLFVLDAILNANILDENSYVLFIIVDIIVIIFLKKYARDKNKNILEELKVKQHKKIVLSEKNGHIIAEMYDKFVAVNQIKNDNDNEEEVEIKILELEKDKIELIKMKMECRLEIILTSDNLKYIFSIRDFVLSDNNIIFYSNEMVRESVPISNTKNNDEKYKRIFKKTYDVVLNQLKGIEISCDIEKELLPVLFVVCDFAATSAKKDRSAITNEILAFLNSDCIENKMQDDVFKNRVDLYGEIIRGKSLRAEWLFGNTNIESNAIVNCGIAFGDVLVNPDCAVNYSSAPVMIHNVFEVTEFATIMTNQVLPEFVNCFKKIYDA